MENLTATLKLIDEMSEKMDKIGQTGVAALEKLSAQIKVADTALAGMEGVAENTLHNFSSASDNAAQAMGRVTNSAQTQVAAVTQVDTGMDALREATVASTAAMVQLDSTLRGVNSEMPKTKESTTDAASAVNELSSALAAAGIIAGLNKLTDALASTVSAAIEFESAIASDKRGNPIVSGGEIVYATTRQPARAVGHIIADALVFPDLHDAELMAQHKCNDISEMAGLVFSSPDEYNHVIRVVFAALGLGDGIGDDELVETAKKLISGEGGMFFWAHVIWQRHGVRVEEFMTLPRETQCFYIASELVEGKDPCRRETAIMQVLCKALARI